MRRTSSAKILPFPRPKTEEERLAQEEQRRRNAAIKRLLKQAEKLRW